MNCPRCDRPAETEDLRLYGGVCPRCVLDFAAEQDAPSFPGLEILGLIGEGGMGVVYKARQTALDRIVALKVLSPRLSGDPEFAARFTREAKALAQLGHPNIVSIHESGIHDGVPYLVMEYVEGTSLRALLAGRKLAPERALAIVPQICDALHYAHARGVVHRDIKPENILIDRQGRVKIADFGLAKVGGEATRVTRSSAMMGTPNYMAPEQVENTAGVDHRADIYSLGVVFYEMLTGELPLGRFKAPSERAAVDARLDPVVLRSLEKEPDLRYQSAQEVKDHVSRLDAAPAVSDGRPARLAYRSLAARLILGVSLLLVYFLLAGGLGPTGFIVMGVLQFFIWRGATRRPAVVDVPAAPVAPRPIEKEPAARDQQASEVKGNLSRVREGRPVSAQGRPPGALPLGFGVASFSLSLLLLGVHLSMFILSGADLRNGLWMIKSSFDANTFRLYLLLTTLGSIAATVAGFVALGSLASTRSLRVAWAAVIGIALSTGLVSAPHDKDMKTLMVLALPIVYAAAAVVLGIAGRDVWRGAGAALYGAIASCLVALACGIAGLLSHLYFVPDAVLLMAIAGGVFLATALGLLVAFLVLRRPRPSGPPTSALAVCALVGFLATSLGMAVTAAVWLIDRPGWWSMKAALLAHLGAAAVTLALGTVARLQIGGSGLRGRRASILAQYGGGALLLFAALFLLLQARPSY